jgi:hypothetical protein
MEMHKVVTRLSVVVVALVTSVVAMQAPASAAWSDCGNGLGCVWDGTSGTGAMKPISVGAHGVDRCYNFSSAWNDKVSSARNRYGAYGDYELWLMMWTGTGCNGLGTSVAPGEQVNFGGSYNNSFSSFKIVTV